MSKSNAKRSPDAPAIAVELRTREGSHGFSCAPGERLLYAALRNGIPVPYECATGTCGTCKGRCPGAPVDQLWAEAPGRSFLKAERGEVLLCQSVATAACEIEVPGRLSPPDAEGADPGYVDGRLENPARLTGDVVAFDVALSRPVSYQAGQFFVLRVPGVEGYRAYSMVNYDEATQRLRFVVKRKPDGAFSDWLFDGTVEGSELELFGPLGRAVFRPREEKNLLAIAGGSGIAGIMSILAHARRSGHFERHRGSVYFGVRTLRDIFFHDELAQEVEAAHGRLRVTVALSDEPAPAERHPTHPGLHLAGGFVHAVAAAEIEAHRENAMAFVAGPPPMVDGALRMLILEARLPASDIRYDKFG